MMNSKPHWRENLEQYASVESAYVFEDVEHYFVIARSAIKRLGAKPIGLVDVRESDVIIEKWRRSNGAISYFGFRLNDDSKSKDAINYLQDAIDAELVIRNETHLAITLLTAFALVLGGVICFIWGDLDNYVSGPILKFGAPLLSFALLLGAASEAYGLLRTNRVIRAMERHIKSI